MIEHEFHQSRLSAFVTQMSDAERWQIILDRDEIDRRGDIGDCLLRSRTEDLLQELGQGTDFHAFILWMIHLSDACHRHRSIHGAPRPALGGPQEAGAPIAGDVASLPSQAAHTPAQERSCGFTLPEGVVGLALCKIAGKEERLVRTEEVYFKSASGVDTVLRRARISGKVGPVGETGDYWADLLVLDGSWIETIALDRESWNSLKNHWMPCRISRG